MARTGRQIAAGEEGAGDAHLASSAGSVASPTLETAAHTGIVDSPRLLPHPFATSTKDTLIALAQLLGRTAACDLMERTTTSAVEPSSRDRGETCR